ncbi:MAG: tetratricopeptide repeat protein [Vulcanimicrobiota bacterium]
MAFFRKRGNSVSLLHGVRHEEFGVRHIKLHTFSGLEQLRAALEEGAWQRLQVQVEQMHPELMLNWNKLREQATELCSAPERRPNLQERIEATHKAARKLIDSLSGLPEPQDLFLKAVGPQLADVARVVLLRYNKLGQMEETTMKSILCNLLPDPESTEMLVDQGREAFECGRVAAAKKYFAAARAYDPCDPDVLNSEAIQWMERRKDDQAESLLEEARTLAYHQLPNPRKSYSWYQHEVRPYIRATYNLALVRSRQERWQEALELCQECLERCPNDGIGARYLLGPLLQSTGQLRLAAEEHRNACHGGLVDPPDSFFDLCNVELQLGNTLPAVEAFCQGVAVNRHIPTFLLKKPRRTALPEYISVDSKECAKCYVQDRHSSWTSESLKTVRALWKDPQLRKVVEELQALEDQLKDNGPGDERCRLLQLSYDLKDKGLGRAAARALHERVLGG